MTSGSIPKKMITFALPLLMGNLFQQLYNTADSLIVGNFLGNSALAAVSSSGNLIFMLIGFFIGLSMGAGVVIARHIGAKDEEMTQVAVHTTISMGVIIGVALSVIGLSCAPLILRLIGTPADVMPESLSYFRIYCLGSTGFVLYNQSVGVLRAAGDSRHPLYFLILSSLVNVVLDLLFIAVFGMGVGGAALATILSQYLSALMSLAYLTRVDETYRLIPKKCRIHTKTLLTIVRIGVPAGIQNAVIGFSNVVVQSHVNHFGKMAMAGIGAASKLEGFAFLPITSFSMAITPFVSQNIGAKDYERARKGARFGILCCVLMAEAIGILFFFLAPYLIAAFDRTPEVIDIGARKLQVTTLFYCLLSLSHAVAAALRGAGKSIVPMIIMLSAWCVLRVAILEGAVMTFGHQLLTVMVVYPVTWGISSILYLVYYLRYDFRNSTL